MVRYTHLYNAADYPNPRYSRIGQQTKAAASIGLWNSTFLPYRPGNRSFVGLGVRVEWGAQSVRKGVIARNRGKTNTIF
jgi:hypothetical protein